MKLSAVSFAKLDDREVLLAHGMHSLLVPTTSTLVGPVPCDQPDSLTQQQSHNDSGRSAPRLNHRANRRHETRRGRPLPTRVARQGKRGQRPRPPLGTPQGAASIRDRGSRTGGSRLQERVTSGTAAARPRPLVTRVCALTFARGGAPPVAASRGPVVPPSGVAHYSGSSNALVHFSDPRWLRSARALAPNHSDQRISAISAISRDDSASV